MNKFKKILIGLIMISLIGFIVSSCSKEETRSSYSNDEMNQDNMVGKWKSVSCNEKYYIAEFYDWSETDYTSDCTSEYTIYDFKSDGTGLKIDYSYKKEQTYEITWVAFKEKLIVTGGNFFDIIPGVYYYPSSVTYNIIGHNSNSMLLESTFYFIDDSSRQRKKLVKTELFKKI